MKLEDFVKSLKVGEHLKLETTDGNFRVVELWRDDEGRYNFVSSNEIYNEFKKPKDFLECVKTDWLECDYEVYKTRAELKAENQIFEKALKSACKIIDDGEICSECPANNICLKNSDITCAENIYDCLMKEAAKK